MNAGHQDRLWEMRQGSENPGRVPAVKETVTVPAGHRMIISPSSPGRTSEGTWLVEPLPKF